MPTSCSASSRSTDALDALRDLFRRLAVACRPSPLQRGRRRVPGDAGRRRRRRRREVGRDPAGQPGTRAAHHPRRLRAVRHAHRSAGRPARRRRADDLANADDLGARHRCAGPTTMSARSASSAPARRRSPTFMRCASCDPGSTEVVVAGRTPDHVDRVVDELTLPGESAVAGLLRRRRGMRHRVRGDTADSALFGLADVRPGTHINLVGSYRLDLREVAAIWSPHQPLRSTMSRRRKAEAGDLHLAVEEGVWSWDKIAGDLTDLASGRLRAHRTTRSRCSRASGSRCRIWPSPNARPLRQESWRHREQVRGHRRRRAGRAVVGVVPHRGRRRRHHHRQCRARQRCGSRQRRFHVHRDRRAPAGSRRHRQRVEVVARPDAGVAHPPEGDSADGAVAAGVRPQLHRVALPIRVAPRSPSSTATAPPSWNGWHTRALR